MPQHIVFRDVPESTRDSIRNYWNRKWRRIERLLQTFPPDQRHLRLIIHNHHPIWDARAVLILSSGTLVAHGKSHSDNWRESLDVAADRLAEEVRRHKGLLHRDYLYQRKRRRQRDIAGVSAAIEDQGAQADRQTFAELLRPAMRGLQDHARRELVLAQLEGTIQPNAITVSDLLDEVVARAYEQFADRPIGPLDRWLTRLLHEVLDARAAEQPPIKSLYETIPPADPRFRVDRGWVRENEPFWDEFESLTLEQVLPDEEAPEPWQQLSAEEQRHKIMEHLQSIPRRQRRAFTLNVLDGWEIEDIALIQGRVIEDVRNDIEDVRQQLRLMLSADEPGSQLNGARTAVRISPL
jgi:DNA-directed RNA polymerase specialized sigma24 family protein